MHISYVDLVPTSQRRQWASVRNIKWWMMCGEINFIYCKTHIGHTHPPTQHTHTLFYSSVTLVGFFVNDQRDAQFFSMYLFLFLTLYVFRAHRAHHQERQIVSTQPLVIVILCRWPCRVQVGSELTSEFTSDLHTTTPLTKSDSYQRLYCHNLSLLMMSTMCSKHVES